MELISWALIVFLVIVLCRSLHRVLSGGARHRTMLVDAVLGTLPLLVLVGGLATMPWNDVLPVPVWWVIAGLTGLLAASITYRLIHEGPSV